MPRERDRKGKRAVVLLSGGLDSATTLFLARRRGYEPYALVFEYGQRHRKEIAFAKRLARFADVSCKVVRFDLPWKGSALLDRSIALRQGESSRRIPSEIPRTYVPARNTIFLSFALSYAEVLGAEAVFIGANARDFSGYPDCRPEYYRAVRKMAVLATKAGVEGRSIAIQTPLLYMSKVQIVRLASKLGVPFQWTWSCYAGGEKACGVCDSCVLRAKGFEKAGVDDPWSPRGKS